MTTETAEIEVVCPGMLEVLSVGKGDLKLTVGGDDPEEIERGRRVIEEMLRKGYTIFVETDVGPARVRRFSPERMTYTIAELPPDDPELASGPPPPAALPPGPPVASKPKKRAREREIPVAGSRATAIGRTAGG